MFLFIMLIWIFCLICESVSEKPAIEKLAIASKFVKSGTIPTLEKIGS